MFGTAVDWRQLHNEELHNLYVSPNIIRRIHSRRAKCPGRVARREWRAYKVW
jgi:hypothetical protein